MRLLKRPSAVCDRGTSATISNSTDPGQRRGEKTDASWPTSFSLSNSSKADVLTDPLIRHVLLSDTVLFSNSPHMTKSYSLVLKLSTGSTQPPPPPKLGQLPPPQWLLQIPTNPWKKEEIFNPTSSLSPFSFFLFSAQNIFGKTEIIHASCADVPFYFVFYFTE